MFGDLGWAEIAVLVVLALFIFGPERLPKFASDVGRGLRQLRRMALSAKEDLQDGLGPEMRDFDVTDLNPRRFVRKHLFEDNDDVLDYNGGSSPTATRRRRTESKEKAPFDADAT